MKRIVNLFAQSSDASNSDRAIQRVKNRGERASQSFCGAVGANFKVSVGSGIIEEVGGPFAQIVVLRIRHNAHDFQLWMMSFHELNVFSERAAVTKETLSHRPIN